MKRIVHPFWTHLPAVGILSWTVYSLVQASPLPVRAPVHYNFQGQPDRWSSPWEMVIVMLGVSLLLMVLSAVIDEQWARGEERKSFNWMALLDEGMVGLLCGLLVGWLNRLPAQDFPFPWEMAAQTVGVALAAGIVVEWLRPHRPSPHAAGRHQPARAEDAPPVPASGRWVWWESQNPGWLNALAIVLGSVMVVMAILIVVGGQWTGWLLLVAGLALFMLVGGIRTSLTRDRIEVRFGLLGLRLFQARIEDIRSVEVWRFSPLADFGGWGIRYGRGGIRGYFMRGNRGVLLQTAQERKVLIGSDRPQRLAALIQQLAPSTTDD